MNHENNEAIAGERVSFLLDDPGRQWLLNSVKEVRRGAWQ
jgi:hypothetical protein